MHCILYGTVHKGVDSGFSFVLLIGRLSYWIDRITRIRMLHLIQKQAALLLVLYIDRCRVSESNISLLQCLYPVCKLNSGALTAFIALQYICIRTLHLVHRQEASLLAHR